MKKGSGRIILVVAVLMLGLCCNVQSALATAVSTSVADLTWSGLSYSGLTAVSYYKDEAEASLGMSYYEHNKSSEQLTVPTISAKVTDGASVALGATSASLITETVDLLSTGTPIDGYASAARTMKFMATASTVTVSIPWQVSVTLKVGTVGDMAYGYSQYSLDLWWVSADGEDGDGVSSTKYTFRTISDLALPYTKTMNGTANIQLLGVPDGAVVFLTGTVYNEGSVTSAVPVPPSVLLLGSGLLGLLGIGIRRRG